jgi:hypothetical protein
VGVCLVIKPSISGLVTSVDPVGADDDEHDITSAHRVGDRFAKVLPGCDRVNVHEDLVGSPLANQVLM